VALRVSDPVLGRKARDFQRVPCQHVERKPDLGPVLEDGLLDALQIEVAAAQGNFGQCEFTA
jgi:hypothetical protein